MPNPDFFIYIRSFFFNLAFWIWNVGYCIFLFPFLPLPQRTYMIFLRPYFHGIYWLERFIAGIDYKVQGLENIPSNGPFMIVSNHQSAYETLKMNILFDWPAFILKKELLEIPLWGWYAKKAGMIAVDRKRAQNAIKSITDNVGKVFAQNRPLIIFPQGTRTSFSDTAATKPYKRGFVKIYEDYNVPIVPMVVKSGRFWPARQFLRYPGIVEIVFLPVISPDRDKDQVYTHVVSSIENVLNPGSSG